MNKYKLLLVSFLFIGSFCGQKTSKCEFNVRVIDRASGSKELGAMVAVFDGNIQIASGMTTKNGIILEAPLGKTYKVVISKPGKVTRFFMVDLKGIDTETLPVGDNVLFKNEVSLFEENANVDWAYIKDNPLTIYSYDGDEELGFDDKLAAKMSAKIEKLLKDADKTKGDSEAEYNAFMKEAQALEASKDYVGALGKYEFAVLKKPGDKPATAKIAELDALLKAKKASDIMDGAAMDNYDALIKAGDILVNAKKYEEALAKYDEAKVIRPKELGVKDKIEDTQEKFMAQKAEIEKDKKYTTAITAGEALLKQKSYKAARDQFTIAANLKKEEQLPKTQLAAIDALLNKDADLAAKKAKIDAEIKVAEELFAQEKWTESKAKYNDVLVLDPGLNVVKQKIVEIDSKLKGLANADAKKAQINKLLEDGKALVTKGETAPAKAKFDEVIKLEPTNAEALAQLEIIKGNQANEAKYQVLVKEGDALAKAMKNTEALAKYESAKEIKTEKSIEDKITALKNALDAANAKKENAEKFAATMKEADGLMAETKLEEAKAKYNEAAALDASSKVPIEKIKAIDKILGEKANAAANIEKAKLEIAAADALRDQKKLGEAKLKYQSAQKLDASQTYASEEIAKIDQQLASDQAESSKKKAIEANLKAGNDFLAASKLLEAKAKFLEVQKLDATNTDAATGLASIAAKEGDLANVAAIKAKFAGLMKEGDDLSKASKFDEAKAKFEEAKSVDASQILPQQKIDAINKLIGDKDALAQKAQQYAALLAEADAAFAANDLTTAKSKYTEATVLNKTDLKPKEGLKAIAKKEADALALQNYAKLYQDLMKSGNDLEEASKWNEALAKYQAAQKLDNAQALPKERIEAVNQKLAALAANDSKAKAYQDAIKIADNLFTANKFNEAKAKYEAAKSLDESQSYPQQRIDAIDQKIAEQTQNAAKTQQIASLLIAGETLLKASNLEEAEAKFNEVKDLDGSNTVATAKLAQIKSLRDAKLAAADKESNWVNLVNAASADASAERFDEAKSKYLEAKKFKSTPELEKSLKDVETAIAAKNASLGAQALYTKTMADGAKSEAANKLSEALTFYQKAGLMAQDNGDAKAKVKQIQDRLETDNAAAETNKLYNSAIASADVAFNAKKYVEAVKMYNVAASIKSNEQYPVDQAAKAAELSKAGTVDKDIEYNSIIKAAQKKLDNKDYSKALELFQRANSDRPADPVPLEKIDFIKNILNSLESEKAAEAKKLSDYKSKMAAAEAQVISKDYSNAIVNFEEAKALQPSESLPQIRIDAVKAILNSQTNAAAKEENYLRLIAEGDNEFKGENYTEAISKYRSALDIKQDNYPKTQIDLASLKLAAKQKEKAYKIAMADGLGNVVSKTYDAAINDFNSALLAKPNDAEALKELANAKRLLEESKIPTVNPLFAKYVAAADGLFAGEKWLEAKTIYEKAQAIDQSSNYVNTQIEACIKKSGDKSTEESEKAYQKIIAKANEYAGLEKYDDAIGLLERAKGLRKTDPYPPQRIEQLLALRNKKVEVPTIEVVKQEGVQEIKLADLGKEEAMSLQEVQKQINKGADKRWYNRIFRVNKRQSTNEKYIAGLDSANMVKNQELSEVFEQQNKKELIDAQNLDVEIRNNSEKIITLEEQQTATQNQSTVFEDNGNRDDSKKVINIENESALNYAKGNLLTDQNSETMKGNILVDQKVAYANDQNNIAELRANDEIMHKMIEDNSKLDFDNGQLRAKNGELMQDVEETQFKYDTKSVTTETDDLYRAQQKTENLKKDGETIFTDAEKDKIEMIDQMQVLEESQNKYNIASDEKDNDLNKVLDLEINKVELANSKAFVKSDEDRLENVEKMKVLDVSVSDFERISNEKEQSAIDSDIKNLDEIEQAKELGFKEAEAALKESVIVVEAEQLKQETNYIRAEQTKTAGYAQSQEALMVKDEQNVLKSAENDKKLQTNTDALVLETKKSDALKETFSYKKEKEMQETKLLLNKLESKEIKFDEKMANTLAQQYPEGVSQESFPKYDNEDILVGQVTRRIVVIGNRGDVYLRHQSLSGLTYQKNGQAITEYIWQSETQNGKLKRNY